MRRLMLILLIALLSGCRTFEIGFVQTPTPDRTCAEPDGFYHVAGHGDDRTTDG